MLQSCGVAVRILIQLQGNLCSEFAFPILPCFKMKFLKVQESLVDSSIATFPWAFNPVFGHSDAQHLPRDSQLFCGIMKVPIGLIQFPEDAPFFNIGYDVDK